MFADIEKARAAMHGPFCLAAAWSGSEAGLDNRGTGELISAFFVFDRVSFAEVKAFRLIQISRDIEEFSFVDMVLNPSDCARAVRVKKQLGQHAVSSVIINNQIDVSVAHLAKREVTASDQLGQMSITACVLHGLIVWRMRVGMGDLAANQGENQNQRTCLHFSGSSFAVVCYQGL
ncbi:MAG TPA: hypothetical protein VL129_03945 [Pseudomonas sp.]|uniref:hypothetical protein n=1 Tax=Pseudomonas sp. TaxID=306 RepID=UPI002CA189E1|nr:hypothetical protein [Pseudomonas sp.]HTO18284.1 hypothetical protein [Pseudomonas sp.]